MTQAKKVRMIDYAYLAMIILPFVFCMILKILTTPAAGDGISISGAQVYFEIPMPLMPLYITEVQVTSVAVIVSIFGLCLYLTHGIKVVPDSKRQLIAEYIVEKVNGLIHDNMGSRYIAFAPFIAAIMGISAFSSLSSLLGLFPPTSDMNIVAGWGILVFIIITHYKLKGGLLPYVKGFFEPVPIFAPFNIIGELATPVSMSFRHYGNVLSGVVIATLISSALGGLSEMLLGWLPGFLGDIPFLRVGIPAVLSVYFDVFSGLMQAFIFAMLTMLYVATGFPEEEYEKRQAKKKKKKALPAA